LSTNIGKNLFDAYKTREAYSRYIKSGHDQDFYEAERTDITLCQAAKKYFDSLGYGKGDKKNLPSINALKQEWATLDAEKKSLYRDYHSMKDNNRDLHTALYNAERMLGITKDGQIHEQTNERQRIKSYSYDAR